MTWGIFLALFILLLTISFLGGSFGEYLMYGSWALMKVVGIPVGPFWSGPNMSDWIYLIIFYSVIAYCIAVIISKIKHQATL